MNELKLGSRYFKLDEERSSLNYTLEDNIIVDCDIDMNFLEGRYEEKIITPYIAINKISLDAEKLNDIKGNILRTSTLEESNKREDYLMLSEDEYKSFESLIVEIIDINEYKAHIIVSGVVVIDEKSDYKKEIFSIEANIKTKINPPTSVAQKVGSSINTIYKIMPGCFIIFGGMMTILTSEFSTDGVLIGGLLTIVGLVLLFVSLLKKEK